MADVTGSQFGDNEPLFYDVSPKWTWAVRIFGIIALLMAALSFIFCIVRAEKQPNGYYYLLACNTVMSCLVGGVNAWWYRKGHLSGDKYWFVMIIAVVVTWQCIATDIYVFNLPSIGNNNTTPAVSTQSVETTTGAVPDH